MTKRDNYDRGNYVYQSVHAAISTEWFYIFLQWDTFASVTYMYLKNYNKLSFIIMIRSHILFWYVITYASVKSNHGPRTIFITHTILCS